MVLPENLTIGGALIMGLIIGLIELFFVHADESGLHWLGHGLHTLPATIIFTFIAMNTGFVLGILGMNTNVWLALGLQVVVGIIAMLKISAAAALVSSSRIGEKKFHVLIIGLLIIVSPYMWNLALGPVLSPLLPGFLK